MMAPPDELDAQSRCRLNTQHPGLLAGNAELLEERTLLEVGLPLVIASEEPTASQEALLALRGQMKPANVVEAR